MKNTRIALILFICLIVLMVTAYFFTKSGIKTLNKQFFPVSGEAVNHNDIEYEKLGFLWQKGNPALSFKGFLITKSEASQDTLFYAEHFLISADLKHKNKHGTGVKVILLSPQIHIYPETLSDKHEVSEMPAHGDIKSTPTILISNLSVHYHTGQHPKVIDSMHLKVEPEPGKIHIQAKHKPLPGYVFHGGTHFSAHNGHYYFDSSYMNLNDVRLMNLNLKIQPHRRSTSDVAWEAWLDSTRLEPLSTDSLQLKGYLDYHSAGNFTANAQHEQTSINLFSSLTNQQGNIDTLNIQINKQQDKTALNSTSASHVTLNLISYPSHLHLQAEQKRNADTLYHTFQHTANVNLGDFSMFKLAGLQGNVIAGYRYASYGNTKQYISGNSKASIQWEHNNKMNYLTHHADNLGSLWELTNDNDNMSAQVRLKGWFNHLFHDKNAVFDVNLYTRSFHIPDKKTSPDISMPDADTKYQPADVFTNKNISFAWQADTLYHKTKTLTTNNRLLLKVSDNFLDLTLNSEIHGNIHGPIKLIMEQTSPHGYTGHLASPGLTIRDKSKIPLISKNIKLPPSKGYINPFSIPCQFDKDSFCVKKTSIRTGDFLLHVRGNGNYSDQYFTLGLTAPANHFKGPAKRILKQKTSPSDSSVLNTVMLHVSRTNGKVHIKTLAQ